MGCAFCLGCEVVTHLIPYCGLRYGLYLGPAIGGLGRLL